MSNNLAIEYIELFQEFHNKHKNKLKLTVKGEEAMLLYLNEKLSKEIITPSIISESLYISTARVAASLNSLEEKGLITREIDLNDRRKIVINLTNKGLELSNKLRLEHLDIYNYVLNQLGEKDSLEFLRIIKKISKILESGDFKC